jgi:hypothetical protein
VAANTPEPPLDRAPTSDGEVRSTLLRLLRLLAAEVARRVAAADDLERDGPPREACTTPAGSPAERIRPRAVERSERP